MIKPPSTIDPNLCTRINSENAETRLWGLRDLRDVIQWHQFAPGELQALAQELVDRVGQETNSDVYEQTLANILEAQGRPPIFLRLEPIIALVSEKFPRQLSYCIEILYLSGNPEYHEYLKTLVDHPSEGVREEVREMFG